VDFPVFPVSFSLTEGIVLTKNRGFAIPVGDSYFASSRLPTALSFSPPAALQFANGHCYAEEVPLPAMRDDGRPLRL